MFQCRKDLSFIKIIASRFLFPEVEAKVDLKGFVLKRNLFTACETWLVLPQTHFKQYEQYGPGNIVANHLDKWQAALTSLFFSLSSWMSQNGFKE